MLPRRAESNYISPAECASCLNIAMIAILCIAVYFPFPLLFVYLSFVNLFPSMYSSIYSWLLGHLNLLIEWFKGPMWLLLGHKKGLGSLEEILKCWNNTASHNPPIGISQHIKGTKKSWSNKAFEKNVGLYFYFMQGCVLQVT